VEITGKLVRIAGAAIGSVGEANSRAPAGSVGYVLLLVDCPGDCWEAVATTGTSSLIIFATPAPIDLNCNVLLEDARLDPLKGLPDGTLSRVASP